MNNRKEVIRDDGSGREVRGEVERGTGLGGQVEEFEEPFGECVERLDGGLGAGPELDTSALGAGRDDCEAGLVEPEDGEGGRTGAADLVTVVQLFA